MAKEWFIDPNVCKYCGSYHPETINNGFCDKKLDIVPIDEYCDGYEIGDSFCFDKELFNPKNIKR